MEIQEGTKMLSQFFVRLHALKKEECYLKSPKILNSGFWKAKILKSGKIVYQTQGITMSYDVWPIFNLSTDLKHFFSFFHHIHLCRWKLPSPNQCVFYFRQHLTTIRLPSLLLLISLHSHRLLFRWKVRGEIYLSLMLSLLGRITFVNSANLE